MSTSVKKTCRACGRTGSQRFQRANTRGKPTYVCNDEGACSKRQAVSGARTQKAKPASRPKARGKVKARRRTTASR